MNDPGVRFCTCGHIAEAHETSQSPEYRTPVGSCTGYVPGVAGWSLRLGECLVLICPCRTYRAREDHP